MNLYLVKQSEIKEYDTWDSFVVVANNERDARQYYPTYRDLFHEKVAHKHPDGEWGKPYSGWCSHPDKAEAQLIGFSAGDWPAGTVLIASFNAG